MNKIILESLNRSYFTLSIAIFEKGASQQSETFPQATLCLWNLQRENRGKPAFNQFSNFIEMPKRIPLPQLQNHCPMYWKRIEIPKRIPLPQLQNHYPMYWKRIEIPKRILLQQLLNHYSNVLKTYWNTQTNPASTVTEPLSIVLKTYWNTQTNPASTVTEPLSNILKTEILKTSILANIRLLSRIFRKSRFHSFIRNLLQGVIIKILYFR